MESSRLTQLCGFATCNGSTNEDEKPREEPSKDQGKDAGDNQWCFIDSWVMAPAKPKNGEDKAYDSTDKKERRKE